MAKVRIVFILMDKKCLITWDSNLGDFMKEKENVLDS